MPKRAKPSEIEPENYADWLSPEEIDGLILAALSARAHSTEELTGIVEWASEARIRCAMIDLAIDGRITLQWSAASEDVRAGLSGEQRDRVARLINGERDQ